MVYYYYTFPVTDKRKFNIALQVYEFSGPGPPLVAM